MVGTPFEFGVAPPLSGNILLAGELCRMAKLHRPGGPAGGLRAGRYLFGQTLTLRPRFGRAKRQNRGRPPGTPALASDPPAPDRSLRLAIPEAGKRAPAAVTASAAGDDLEETPGLADDRLTCYHRGVAQTPTSGAMDGGTPN